MTTSLTFEQVLNQRVQFNGAKPFTGVVVRADPTTEVSVVLVSDADGRTYNVALARLSLVFDSPSLTDDLCELVQRLEAGAQCSAATLAGDTKAYEMLAAASAVRGVLAQHGHECAPIAVYASREVALRAHSRFGG